MVILGSQLRDTEIVDLVHVLTLIDTGVQVNKVPAGFACRRKVNGNISLTIEAAGIAKVGVVIDKGIDISRLRPPHPFEVDSDGSASWAGSRLNSKGRRRDCKGWFPPPSVP